MSNLHMPFLDILEKDPEVWSAKVIVSLQVCEHAATLDSLKVFFT